MERSDEMAPRNWCDPPKTRNKKKKRDDKTNSDDPLADLLEWLEEFKDNLVDAELPASAHSSQESDQKHPTKVETKSKRHSMYAHFPKDRNCDVCLRTKITKASCRRRTGEALPRAEKFGDLITADHKVLNEGRESRDNHRYAVVVQDLATQWIQSFSCKTKSSHETEKKLIKKFLEPSQAPKVVYTDDSMEFGRACEVLSWNHSTSTPHRSETKGIAERAVRRVQEGTSAVLLQSWLDERWWSDSMECRCYLRNVQDPPGRWANAIRKTIWRAIHRPNNTCWSNGWISSVFTERSVKSSSIWQESITKNLSGLWADRGENLERKYLDCRPGRFGKVGCIRYLSSKNQRRRSIDETKKMTADGTAKLSGRDYEFRVPTLRRERAVRSENLSWELQGESGVSQPTEFTDDAEACADFWSIQGDFIYRRRNEPRV